MKKLLLTILSVILIFNLQAQIVTGFNNITDTDGNTHSLNTYLNNGKFVVLNFYLLTCGNCMATAPKIESIYQSYGQNQCNVVVLSFNITDPATNSDCDNFATTYGNPSPPNFNHTEASWFQFYSSHGGAFAQTYVLTPNGDSVIYAHAGGVLNQPALESVLNNAITNSNSSTNITVCNSYIWPVNNQNYTTSGTYSSLINSPGCPPYTETLNLTINSSTSNITTYNACDSYTWPVNNQTYTTSGTYTGVSTNTAGCTHTETLNLTINNSTTNTNLQTACDTYTWLAPLGDGNTYTTSGNHTQISTNASGCTETNILDLTIIYSNSSYDTLSVGTSIVWNGMPLNVSGDYSVTLINSVGCDSIANLNLTVTTISTWNCIGVTCVDPTTGMGIYSSLSACQAACVVSAIQEQSSSKELLKVIDLLGRETKGKKNKVLFYIYDDGTVEKRIVIE